MRYNLIDRLKEEWAQLDPVDPLRGLIADAIDALAEQPAQQEPVVKIHTWHKNGMQHAELLDWGAAIEVLPDGEHEIYASPPASKPLTDVDWKARALKAEKAVEILAYAGFTSKPLTDEEIVAIIEHADGSEFSDVEFARAIEAAHGIKEENNG